MPSNAPSVLPVPSKSPLPSALPSAELSFPAPRLIGMTEEAEQGKTPERVISEVSSVGGRKSEALKDAVERLISRLKEVKYSFDEQAIRKYDLETQKMVLEEMWYDHLHEQEKSAKR